MAIRLDTVPASDRQTDRQTDRLTDRHRATAQTALTDGVSR